MTITTNSGIKIDLDRMGDHPPAVGGDELAAIQDLAFACHEDGRSLSGEWLQGLMFDASLAWCRDWLGWLFVLMPDAWFAQVDDPHAAEPAIVALHPRRG